jgi:hypothetical protein
MNTQASYTKTVELDSEKILMNNKLEPLDSQSILSCSTLDGVNLSSILISLRYLCLARYCSVSERV